MRGKYTATYAGLPLLCPSGTGLLVPKRSLVHFTSVAPSAPASTKSGAPKDVSSSSCRCHRAFELVAIVASPASVAVPSSDLAGSEALLAGRMEFSVTTVTSFVAANGVSCRDRSRLDDGTVKVYFLP